MAGVGAMALVLLAMFVPPTDSAQAASSCTGWRSTISPPSSIRVYRTGLGRSVTVDFRRYVLTVMASEWGPHYAVAALSAGAVAIKQYGWYYAMHWRGGRDAAGRCYDVVDTTVDQVYNPNRPIAAIYGVVVDQTWRWFLRKGSLFFLTGYRSGDGICGAQQDGWHLMQRNASLCASRRGESAESILRRYYGADVSLVIPGFNDITGDGIGDVTAVITDASNGDVAATVLSTDPRMPPVAVVTAATVAVPSADPSTAPAATPSPAPAAPASGTASGITAAANDLSGAPLAIIDGATLLGRATADMNGDGRIDLVQALVGLDGTVRIQVMRSTGSGFAPAVTWWTSAPGFLPVPVAGGTPTATLVTGDFDGDGRGDVGIVETVTPSAPGVTPTIAPLTRLLVLHSTGTALTRPVTQWQAPIDLSGSQFLAGDVSGDGRADLIVLRDRGDGTTVALVAASTDRGGLGRLRTAGSVDAPLDALHPLLGDITASGRDSIILGVRTGDDQLALDVLLPAPSGTFATETWWTSQTPFSWAASRLAVADLSGDGRADVVAYVDAGSGNGTTVDRFTSTGRSFRETGWTTLPTLDWGTIQVF